MPIDSLAKKIQESGGQTRALNDIFNQGYESLLEKVRIYSSENDKLGGLYRDLQRKHDRDALSLYMTEVTDILRENAHDRRLNEMVYEIVFDINSLIVCADCVMSRK